ncbi:nei1 [Symbiodinium pilosum]|uniref:DNA-(apurinic or apyrimidinic site) lyase n=1 Tax=Symbiodinium pilosum TaxID=2952 RepID=A0A812VGG8_SYMPI|nr:nei1 [Symbiodinium pilosum]
MSQPSAIGPLGFGSRTMVEGDGCHRIAAKHRKELVGRKMAAKSPNGRFRGGAQAIVKCGGVLLKIEVHGKNMFYFFGKAGGDPSIVVHVHFGMAGAFAVYKEQEPELTKNIRLRLETVDAGTKLVAHLSAMTVKHGKPDDLYNKLVAKLGADPLREDADPECFADACAKAKKPIGTVLMDQSISAGVGNIYRSEILYEAGVHPKQLANTLPRAEVLKIWNTAVKQMQAGFKSGSIWGSKPSSFCYGKTKSACGGKVKKFSMGGRSVYACQKRQQITKAPKATAKAPALRRAGTSHMDNIVSAVQSENKKRRTGEGLGVQHLALKDDETRKAALSAVRKRPSKK